MKSLDPDWSKNPMGRVCILGGSGFVGTRLAQLLTERYVAVRIGDLHPSQMYPDLWQHCDVRQATSVAATIADADVIVNLAAEHRDDVFPVSRYHDTNVDGARQVCTAATSTRIKQIVFTSSAAVYGFPPHPIDENGPFSPFNEYGKTKLEAERVYRAWAAEDASRSLVIVRPTVVFGEGNRGNVYNLLRQIASGRFLMVGSGRNKKSMAYVGNVVAFLAHSLSFGPGIHTFNYVDGPDMTTRELVSHVQSYLGRPGKLRYCPRPLALAAAQGLDLVARLTGRSFPISAIRIRKFCETTQFRAEKAFNCGFVSPFSLAQGLERTIQVEFLDS
jgi:nucleoside-diphosphate-sugar epimerase